MAHKLSETTSISGLYISDNDPMFNIDFANDKLACEVRDLVRANTKYKDKENSKWIQWLVIDVLRDRNAFLKWGYEIMEKHTADGSSVVIKVGA